LSIYQISVIQKTSTLHRLSILSLLLYSSVSLETNFYSMFQNDYLADETHLCQVRFIKVTNFFFITTPSIKTKHFVKKNKNVDARRNILNNLWPWPYYEYTCAQPIRRVWQIFLRVYISKQAILDKKTLKIVQYIFHILLYSNISL